MARTLKVAIAGLGPVGQAVARAVLQTPALKLVAAADPAPLHAGKDVGVVLGLPRKIRVKVEGNPDRFFRKVRADVAFVCTSSLLKDVKPQIAALVAHRINVLTTCEELAWPVPARAAAFRDLDRLAKKKKVSVLATGVNPGFAMDALALALTAPCARVRRVSVTRVVDAAARKLPLQRRVGAGLNLAQFRRAVTDGSVRHVGLVESAHMVGGRPRLEARPRGRDAGARHRPPRPRHRVPSHPGRRRRRHPAGGARLPRGRARDQPRPAGLRRGRVSAGPRPRGRRPAGRRHDRGRRERGARHRGGAPEQPPQGAGRPGRRARP